MDYIERNLSVGKILARLPSILIIFGIPLLLLIIHIAPGNLATNFSLSTKNPELIDSFVSSYLHYSFEHLKGNVVAYLSAISLLYMIHSYLDRVNEFNLLSISIFIITPLTTSFLTVFFYGVIASVKITSAGFSGISLAFFGSLSYYSAVLELKYMQSKINEIPEFHSLFVFIVMGGFTILRLGNIIIGLISIISGLIFLYKWLINIISDEIPHYPNFIIFMSVASLAWVIYSTPVKEEINIIAHLGGFGCGALISSIYYRIFYK